MITRRSLFRRSAVLPAAALAGFGMPALALSQTELLTKLGQKPKKIIHVVSDGMSVGTLSCASIFSQEIRKQPLQWMELLKTPGAVQALVCTRSLNSPVTDSSAASSAWGTGSRVVNGVLNMLPSGERLTPIMRLLRPKGWKTGLVTTAEITHATPAGFVAVQRSRGDSLEIAGQYLEEQVDVLLGGGTPYFLPKRRKDKRDLVGDFAKAGYEVVYNKTELANSDKSKRLLGLFADGHLPYTVDQNNTVKLNHVPTLAEMTRAALDRLQASDHFMLQVEGARVDHAAHNSDAAAAIWDQIALDDALKVCLEFQKENPDTLVVVTTDHANSNLGLNGMDGGYSGSGTRFKNLAGVKMSYSEIMKLIEKKGKKVKVPKGPNDAEDKVSPPPNPYPRTVPLTAEEKEKDEKEQKEKFTAAVQTATGTEITPPDVMKILAETTGYKPSERRATIFCQHLTGSILPLYDQLNSPVSQLGQLMANWLGVGWTGNTHTADYVNLVAYGPGSEHFGGFLENTDIFGIYTKLAGIDFKNPHLPHYAYQGGGPEAHEVEATDAAWV